MLTSELCQKIRNAESAREDYTYAPWHKKTPGENLERLEIEKGTVVLLGSFSSSGFSALCFGRLGSIFPTDLVALWCSTGLADCTLSSGFMRAAAAHFLEDAFSIKLGLKTLESTIYGFSVFDINATIRFRHKIIPFS